MNNKKQDSTKKNYLLEEKKTILTSLRFDGFLPLSFASEEIIGDRHFMLKAIEISEEAFNFISEDLQHDSHFLIEALKINKAVADLVDESWFNDVDFVHRAIKEANLDISYVQDHLLSEKHIAMALVESDASAYDLLPESLKNDRDIIMQVVQSDESIINQLDDKHKHDFSIYLAAIQNNQFVERSRLANIYKKIPSVLLTHDNIKKLVSKRGEMYYFLSDEHKNDREIILPSVKQNGLAYRAIPKKYKEDHEIITHAIQSCWHVTDDLPKSIFDHVEMVQSLMQYNNEIFEKATQRIKNHYETAQKYVSLFYNGLCRVGKELQDNKEFVIMSIQAHRNNYFCASQSIQNDADVIEEAINQRVNFKELIESLSESTIYDQDKMMRLVKFDKRFCVVLPENLKNCNEFMDVCLKRHKEMLISSDEKIREVMVEFPDLSIEYSYNCSLQGIKVGDRVKVSGKLSDQMGLITAIFEKKSEKPYMQNVVSLIDNEGMDQEYFLSYKGVEVMVEFPELYIEYSYNCNIPGIKVGDQVKVSGKLSDEIGIITKIIGEKNEAIYMQNIIEVIDNNYVDTSSEIYMMDLDKDIIYNLSVMTELDHDESYKFIPLIITFNIPDIYIKESYDLEVKMNSGEGIEGEFFCNRYHIMDHDQILAVFHINELSNSSALHDIKVETFKLDKNIEVNKMIIKAIYHFKDIGYCE